MPDGTTALVRCPACKTIFSPAAGIASPESPAEPEDQEEETEREQRPQQRRRKRSREDAADQPRRRKRGSQGAEPDDAAEPGREQDENPDFDPPDPSEKPRTRKRRDPDQEKLTPEERIALERAFARAATGCRLIWLSFTMFMLSMVLILGLWFQTAFTEPSYAFILTAGVIGAINWLLAAAGVALCLSGPRAPGFLGYGVGAAAAIGVHLLLLLVLVGQGKEHSPGKVVDPDGPGQKLGLVPTRLDAFTFYLTFLMYHDQDLIPKAQMTLSMVVGVAEVIRTMLILMLLSSLARAGGDEDLSGKCTRAAGVATFGAGVLAVLMLLFVAVIVETNASSGTFSKILFTTLQMGIYAMLAGTMLPGMLAAREVADCCEEPFQSQLPML